MAAPPDPTSWDDAQRVAKAKRGKNQEAWVAWGVDQGADAAKLLAAAQALLEAAAKAATAAGKAAGQATAAAEGGAVGAAVDAAAAATQATEAEAKKIEAWKYAAQAIALANEVNPA